MIQPDLRLDEAIDSIDDESPPLSRRDLMAMVGAGAAGSVLASCVPRPAEAPASDGAAPDLADPLCYSSASALAAAIRAGSVSSEEAVRACLERIQEVNERLNAAVQLAAERALARAREADAARARGESWGPLHGVPMTIKDSLDTAGMVSTGGTRGRISYMPDQDATVVARLRKAGAILLGKTNTPELTLSFETDNLIYGRTNNPFDLSRTSGGSSGGAAAIVAAGGAPFDIGSDYGGSIRLPAHFCGVAGLKPSAGRVPRTGHIYPYGGIQDSFQQLGPIARSVDDLSLLLPLIAGPDWIDPGVLPLPLLDPAEVDLASLRVSFHSDNGIATPTAETRRTVETVARGLASAVRSIEEIRPFGLESSYETCLAIYDWDGGAAVRRLLSEAGTTEHTLHWSTESKSLSAEELDRALVAWYEYRSRMHSFLESFDAILCPVNAGPAHPHGDSLEEESLPSFSYTFAYNALGWPGAVVRAGTSPQGLPIGVQIVTRPGREDVALALAKWVESRYGGYRRPAI